MIMANMIHELLNLRPMTFAQMRDGFGINSYSLNRTLKELLACGCVSKSKIKSDTGSRIWLYRAVKPIMRRDYSPAYIFNPPTTMFSGCEDDYGSHPDLKKYTWRDVSSEARSIRYDPNDIQMNRLCIELESEGQLC